VRQAPERVHRKAKEVILLKLRWEAYMRTRSIRLWISLGLLLSVTGAWAQSANSTNANQSVAELRKMAESGNPYGQYMLGYRYETGFGVLQDYASAAEWYLKASEQGYATAQWSLGLLYEQNQGVPQSYEKAYFWLDLAASAYTDEMNHSLRFEVVSARDSAAKHLTKAKLRQVQEQTARFLATHPKSY
jgi:hypothetical protein